MTSIVDRIFNLTYARKLELVSTLGLDNTFVRVVIDKCARRNRQVFSLSLRDIIYLPISEQNWLR